MSGLGIVLENNHLHPSSPNSSHPMESCLSRNGSNEALLPPLPLCEPHSPSQLRSNNLSASMASLNNSPSSTTGRLSADEIHPISRPVLRDSRGVADHSINDLNDFFADQSFALYELDSPCLNIDKFPTVLEPMYPVSNVSSSPSHAHNNFYGTLSHPSLANSAPVVPSATATATATASSSSNLQPSKAQPASNSSPMKRLRSLKNTIRKLSFLKRSLSTTTSSTPSTPMSARDAPTSSLPTPVSRCNVSPAGRFSSDEDGSYRSSASNSIKSSTFSALAYQNVHAMMPISACACAANGSADQNGHSHTVSLGLMPALFNSGRKRTLSNPASFSSMNTTLPSPVIMILENLNSSKKNLSELEQSFFSQIQSVGELTNSSVVNGHRQSRSQSRLGQDEVVKSNIAKLTTPDELIEYSLYLNEHKKSIEGAYDITKEKLHNSGWCTSHDLETLNLQKDSSLSQIDTKLLQIEEKLNSEFSLSMLNNACGEKHTHPSTLRNIDVARPPRCSRENSMSPSLKTLESRCFAFTTADPDSRA